MKKTKNKKLFLCLTAPAALITFVICASLLSCLQADYDTSLLDYVPSTVPVDIKSSPFSVAQGSNILIVKLKGGTFKASLSLTADKDKFLLDGKQLTEAGAASLVRDSDTQVRIQVSPSAGVSHRLTVTSGALLSPANRVSVDAVRNGWFPVDQNTVNNIFGNALIWSIGYGDGKFVAAGEGGRMACYSGGNWTAVLPGTSAGQSGFWNTDTIRAVAYGNGKFIAAGYEAKMAFSATGTDWTGWKESAFNGGSILALAYGNGKFVAAGDKGIIRYSGNGETWNNAQGAPFGDNAILGLAYGQISGVHRFVAVGNGGKIVWSADGITWTQAASSGFAAAEAINAVAYGNGKFVAVGNNGTIAHSSDGNTWASATSVFSGTGVLNVCYGSGKFVAVGHNGKMAESIDGGQNWTA
ncbi:MAG: hypothetical protein LBK63_08390, partial [Treponema sp.]|nr:hypothetical protein [Treponema sp.]